MITVTIDLNKNFTGLDGKPFKSNNQDLAPAHQIVANFIYNTYSQDKSDKLRNRTWAQELYKSGTLETDKKGMDSILSICSQAGMLDGLYCQLQDWMDEYKERWDRLKEETKTAPKEKE